MEPTKQADLAESKAGQAEREVDAAGAKAATAEPKAGKAEAQQKCCVPDQAWPLGGALSEKEQAEWQSRIAEMPESTSHLG